MKNIKISDNSKTELKPLEIPTNESTVGESLSSLEKKVLSVLEEKAENINRKIIRVEDITHLGFIVIIIMVIGLFFGYLQFFYLANKNDDYKYDTYQKILDTNNDLNIFKNCLNKNHWQNQKCFEN